jgi:hypothetical protein
MIILNDIECCQVCDRTIPRNQTFVYTATGGGQLILCEQCNWQAKFFDSPRKNEKLLLERTVCAVALWLFAFIVAAFCILNIEYYHGGNVRGFDLTFTVNGYSCGTDITPTIHPYCSHG